LQAKIIKLHQFFFSFSFFFCYDVGSLMATLPSLSFSVILIEQKAWIDQVVITSKSKIVRTVITYIRGSQNVKTATLTITYLDFLMLPCDQNLIFSIIRNKT